VPTPKPSGSITEQEIIDLKRAKLTGFELYHIEDDIAETTDRSESEREIFERMKRQMQDIYAEVQAEAPLWPAWQIAGYEGKIISEYYRKQAAQKKQKQQP
ncbi:MAG: arylsulfatase, partial [Planctomycetaceae bacterium]|nr:arylsulfatase [Planctomycetaceae bacterium]